MSDDVYRNNLAAAHARIDALESDLQAATARNAELAIENARLEGMRRPEPQRVPTRWAPIVVLMGLSAVCAGGWIQATGNRDDQSERSDASLEECHAEEARVRKVGVECAVTLATYEQMQWTERLRDMVTTFARSKHTSADPTSALDEVADCDAKMRTCLNGIAGVKESE